MSLSGSDSESRTAAVGRKRKNHLIEAERTENDSTIVISDDSDGRSDGSLAKRRKAEHSAVPKGRQSSVESGEISVISVRSKESGELSSESEGGSDDEDDDDHDDDSSDTDSESDADGSATDDSDSDESTAAMSISSGDEYEPPDITSGEHANATKTMLQLQDVSPTEQYMQYRYFHLTRPDVLVYCLCCGARGHLSGTCPERRCPHCQAVEKHSPHGCPQVRKCSRCRQPGHDSRTCTNKTNRGLLTCDVCSEDGHVEEECSRLWSVETKRNYDGVHQLEDGFMRKVCYRCGDCGPDAHWGDDCPMYHRRDYTSAELNLNTTWSAKHADRFIVGKERKPLPPAVEDTAQEEQAQEEEASTTNWQTSLLDSLLDAQRDQ